MHLLPSAFSKVFCSRFEIPLIILFYMFRDFIRKCFLIFTLIFLKETLPDAEVLQVEVFCYTRGQNHFSTPSHFFACTLPEGLI